MSIDKREIIVNLGYSLTVDGKEYLKHGTQLRIGHIAECDLPYHEGHEDPVIEMPYWQDIDFLHHDGGDHLEEVKSDDKRYGNLMKVWLAHLHGCLPGIVVDLNFEKNGMKYYFFQDPLSDNLTVVGVAHFEPRFWVGNRGLPTSYYSWSEETRKVFSQ